MAKCRPLKKCDNFVWMDNLKNVLLPLNNNNNYVKDCLVLSRIVILFCCFPLVDVYLSVCLCLSFFLSFCLSVNLSVCLCLSVCLSIHSHIISFLVLTWKMVAHQLKAPILIFCFQCHPFFRSINWEDLYSRKVEPTFKPNIVSILFFNPIQLHQTG